MRIFRVFRKLEELKDIINDEIEFEGKSDIEKNVKWWRGIQKRFDMIEKSLRIKYDSRDYERFKE